MKESIKKFQGLTTKVINKWGHIHEKNMSTKPHDHPHDDEVDEKKMSDAQMEKREEIVKELKKKTEDFKKKYGDRWEDVMYATATKLAMK